MRKALFPLLGLAVLTAASCGKDPEVMKSKKDLLHGKWMMQRAVEELYSPATTLIDSDEVVGEPSDSLVFKPNNILYSYEGSFEEQSEYQLVNDSTLHIEQERWKVTTLNERELTLVQDETFMNERYVIRIFLVR
jgi:hypothetical protein